MWRRNAFHNSYINLTVTSMRNSHQITSHYDVMLYKGHAFLRCIAKSCTGPQIVRRQDRQDIPANFTDCWPQRAPQPKLRLHRPPPPCKGAIHLKVSPCSRHTATVYCHCTGHLFYLFIFIKPYRATPKLRLPYCFGGISLTIMRWPHVKFE